MPRRLLPGILVFYPGQDQISTPTKINPSQLESLKNNSDFKEAGAKAAGRRSGSIFPPGIDAKSFAPDNSGIRAQIQLAVPQ
jgi:hypothetical protein